MKCFNKRFNSFITGEHASLYLSCAGALLPKSGGHVAPPERGTAPRTRKTSINERGPSIVMSKVQGRAVPVQGPVKVAPGAGPEAAKGH